MKKPVILITKPESLGELSALQKAHVKGYTRKDGTFVKEHDTSVTAKPKVEGFGRGDKVKVHKPGQISHGVEGTVIGSSKVKQDHVSIKTLDGKTVSHHKDDLVPAVARPEKSAGDQYGHPNVVGHAENLKGGDASKAHGMHFAGKEYIASGKEGKSMHDDTPVRHFTELTGTGDDDGEHVWMDHSGRVHADDTSSVKRLRGEYEAHAGKTDQKPAGGDAKPKHSAATLSALADQHEAESERQDKLATKKGANHPDYEKHVIASAHHAKAQRHAEKARDAKDEGERDAHLEAHARYKALAEKAEASVGAAPAGSKNGGYVAPKDGEVGHSEHTQYGAYFRKGDKVRDGSGKEHEVMEHRGAEVKTYGGGSFHPTKLSHVSSKPSRGDSALGPALHHSDLKEGDELIGPDGEKHEYSHTTRGLGRMKIETRAGYSHPAEKDGTLPGWKKTGRNNMTGEGH